MSHALGSETASPHLARKAISMTRHDAPLPAVSQGAGKSLPTEDELREIASSLRGLRYGSVTVVVQDGVIIQIDRVEKRRLRTRRENADNST